MTEPRRIRVMVIENNTHVRKGLSIFLSAYSDLELVAEASTGQEGIGLCSTAQPNVVLFNVGAATLSEVDAIRAMRAAYPGIQVIALVSLGQEELVKPVLQAGAIGYIRKSISADEVAMAVRSAVPG